ncbi:hypothetical protein [Qaidamihabitans albus]|uniref:hypothetical protein n=1 Tax=Qaidamihabitans albus TaxID=2795733 RepID=UPI0027DD1F97|nr:hypothetical protein [Qaidamihabitans albus]
MSTPMFLARPLPGVVGERRRMCHVFPAPASERPPSTLTALCGAWFARGQLELLDGPRGMPCELCLRTVPQPTQLGGTDDRPDDLDAHVARIERQLDELSRAVDSLADLLIVLRDSLGRRRPETCSSAATQDPS